MIIARQTLLKHWALSPLKMSLIAAPPPTAARLQLRVGRFEGRQNSHPTDAGTLAHGLRFDQQIAHACDHMHVRNRTGDDRLVAPLNLRRLHQPLADGASSAWIHTIQRCLYVEAGPNVQLDGRA